MDIQFKGIDHKLDTIHSALREQNINTEKRFSVIEQDLKNTQGDVDKLDKSITKVIAIGGTIWSAVTLLGGFVLNRIF